MKSIFGNADFMILRLRSGSRQRARTPANRLDFNVWSAAKHAEKVHYIHQNPVRRGLVTEPDQWFWSSFRAYACREPGIVAVNVPGSATLKVRGPAA